MVEKIRVLDWLRCRPDSNPNEKLWYNVNTKFEEQHFSSGTALAETLKHAWVYSFPKFTACLSFILCLTVM